MSQKSRIRRALQDGAKITPLSALRNFQCMRLADVIFKLRKDGLDIETGWREQKGKKFACYSLRGVEHRGPGAPRKVTS